MIIRSTRKSILGILPILLLSISSNGQVLPKESPEKVGLSSERLNRIDSLLQNFVDHQKLVGVVTMVARHGKIVHSTHIGMMDIETNNTIQLNTIFRIASMSKPIISVAAMTLYEKGCFQLNDPVSKYIPEFKDLRVYTKKEDQTKGILKREMTIQDLLRHTSGLTYGLFGNTPVDSMYNSANVLDENGTLKDMIHKLAQIPLLYQPGEQWNYSVSTDVLGYLIEVISGKPLDEFLKESIFNPLGMKNTGFFVPEGELNRLATLYTVSKEGKLMPSNVNKLRYSKKPGFLSGGGGLFSTIDDYMIFSQMLLNKGELNGKRILSPKTVELMSMNHVPNQVMPIKLGFLVDGHGFGLGFRVLTDIPQSATLGSQGSFGWFGIFGTYFYIDPKEDLIGILMTQFRGPYSYPGVKEFQVLMYQSIIN
jgi:CubicO group peptidase (beta-lactamase class C family)